MRFWFKKSTSTSKSASQSNSKITLSKDCSEITVDLAKCFNRSVSAEQAQKIAKHLVQTQDVLSIGDGPSPDFDVAHTKMSLLAIKGNIKTALIVLRHAGLLSPEETSKAVDNIGKSKNNPIQNNSKYNTSFNKAQDAFMISSFPGYQEKAQSSYFSEAERSHPKF